MRVTATITLERSRTCGVCIDDENAAPGARCYCAEYEEALEVVGDVEPVGDGRIHATEEFVRIASVKSVVTGRSWSDRDLRCIEDAEREAMESALWAAYVAQRAPAVAVANELTSVMELLKTSVSLALEMGTDEKRILAALRQVRHTAIGMRNATKEAACGW